MPASRTPADRAQMSSTRRAGHCCGTSVGGRARRVSSFGTFPDYILRPLPLHPALSHQQSRLFLILH
jgi:hypothetical protein